MKITVIAIHVLRGLTITGMEQQDVLDVHLAIPLVPVLPRATVTSIAVQVNITTASIMAPVAPLVRQVHIQQVEIGRRAKVVLQALIHQDTDIPIVPLVVQGRIRILAQEDALLVPQDTIHQLERVDAQHAVQAIIIQSVDLHHVQLVPLVNINLTLRIHTASVVVPDNIPAQDLHRVPHVLVGHIPVPVDPHHALHAQPVMLQDLQQVLARFVLQGPIPVQVQAVVVLAPLVLIHQVVVLRLVHHAPLELISRCLPQPRAMHVPQDIILPRLGQRLVLRVLQVLMPPRLDPLHVLHA
jgi:hypothetical protein